MRRTKIYLLIVIAFILSGCQNCSCDVQDTTLPSDTVTTNTSLYVYADGCSLSSGAVDSNGFPTGSCDASGQYVNRGRWVKAPNISLAQGAQVNISTEGSIYYCSTGYDNQNPSSTFVVKPGVSVKNIFSDGSQMPVTEGQIILVTTVPDVTNSSAQYVGVNTSGSNSATNCSSLLSPYSSFKDGICQGYNLLGLTVYVDNTEIVTLDSTYTSNSPYYPYAESRKPYLFSFIDPNSLSSFFSDINAKYHISLNNIGNGIYSFMIPSGIKGKLGFAIAEGYKKPNIAGIGQYTLQIMSTSPACYVEQAVAGNQPGNRGALELLAMSTNPNDVDTAIASFNSLNGGNEINTYYPELNKYISSFTGVTITSNASALSGLVINSAPSLSPFIITSSNYNLDTSNISKGNIWLRVRDDYYSDNVGQYNVSITSTVHNSGVVSKFLNELITPIIDLFDNLSEEIYISFTPQVSKHYIHIVKLSLLIYMMVYGIEFALGLVSISAYDLLIRIFKVAVVIQLFDKNSWVFFDTYFFELFKGGRDWLIEMVTGDYTNNKSGIFGFIDDIFNVFFAAGTWVKIMALFFNIVGFLYLSIIIYIISYYLYILSKVIVAYLLAVVGISVLIPLAPIFFVLMLFKHTRKFFDNWVKHLVDYALQPVLMFGALYILNIIFLIFWNSVMDFEVCWGGLWSPVKVPLKSWTLGFLPDFSLGCIIFYNVKGGVNIMQMFANIFPLYLITAATEGLIAHIPEITAKITGVSSASAVNNAAGAAVDKGIETSQKALGTLGSVFKSGANFASNAVRSLGKRKGGEEQTPGPNSQGTPNEPSDSSADSNKQKSKSAQRKPSSISSALGNRK